MAMIRSQKLRDSAEGENCTMGSPMCNGNPATVCWCHSNYQEHGKGCGLKAHDIFGFYGCSGCHQWYDIDSRKTDNDEVHAYREHLYHRANAKSLVRAVEKGVIRL